MCAGCGACMDPAVPPAARARAVAVDHATGLEEAAGDTSVTPPRVKGQMIKGNVTGFAPAAAKGATIEGGKGEAHP